MSISKQDIDKAIKAFNRLPPLAEGGMPEVLDRVYHSVVGLRAARRAKWEPELMVYWYRALGRALEHWRVAREEIDEEERERPIPIDDAQPAKRRAAK